MYLSFGVEKSFECGNCTFSIFRKSGSSGPFILTKNRTYLTRIGAYECNSKIYFCSIRPIWTFWNPVNRLAIKEAIRILKEIQKTFKTP